MARKSAKPRNRGRESLHLVLDADLASRVRAFAGFHGRTLSEVAAEGLRLVTRGFSARQEPAGPRGVVGGPASAGAGAGEGGHPSPSGSGVDAA